MDLNEFKGKKALKIELFGLKEKIEKNIRFERKWQESLWELMIDDVMDVKIKKIFQLIRKEDY